MISTPVLDATQDDPALAEATALSLIDALMTQQEALRKLDKVMYPRDPDEQARRRSQRAFLAWQEWNSEADELIGRLRTMTLSDTLRDRANELLLAWAHGSCVIKMTLERLERALAQVACGETISGEQVRHDVRARTIREVRSG